MQISDFQLLQAENARLIGEQQETERLMSAAVQQHMAQQAVIQQLQNELEYCKGQMSRPVQSSAFSGTVQVLEAEVGSLRDGLRKKEMEMQAARLEAEGAAQECAQLRGQVQFHQRLVEQLKEKVAAQNDEIQALMRVGLQKQVSTGQQMAESKGFKQTDLFQTRVEIERLNSQLERQQQQHILLENQLFATQKQFEEAQRERETVCEQYETKISILQSQMASLQAQKTEADAETLRVRRDADQLAQKVREQEAELSELKARPHEMALQKEAAYGQKIQALLQENLGLQQRLFQFQTEIARLNSGIIQMKTEYNTRLLQFRAARTPDFQRIQLQNQQIQNSILALERQKAELAQMQSTVKREDVQAPKWEQIPVENSKNQEEPKKPQNADAEPSLDFVADYFAEEQAERQSVVREGDAKPNENESAEEKPQAAPEDKGREDMLEDKYLEQDDSRYLQGQLEAFDEDWDQ